MKMNSIYCGCGLWPHRDDLIASIAILIARRQKQYAAPAMMCKLPLVMVRASREFSHGLRLARFELTALPLVEGLVSLAKSS